MSAARLELDFAGCGVTIDGASESLARAIRERWDAYVGRPAGSPALSVSVRYGSEEIDESRFDPKAMDSRFQPGRASYAMPEGRVTIDPEGRAELELAAELGRREFFVLANLFRAALAWRLPRIGGAMVHAAGLVVEDRAFVLVGSEGSGKSTWAAMGERAGGIVISDDIVLVRFAGTGAEALGAPFRSTHRGAWVNRRWPIAAFLFPKHGRTPRLKPSNELLARARLAANLPFVADAIEQDDVLGDVLDRLAGGIPCHELTFDRDPGYVRLLRDWSGAGS